MVGLQSFMLLFRGYKVDESRWSILEILNSANILGIKHPRIDVSFMSISRLYRIMSDIFLRNLTLDLYIIIL